MPNARDLPPEHLELLRRYNARLDKLRKMVESAEAMRHEDEVDAGLVVGDLDSALALAGQTIDELELINKERLPNDRTRRLYLSALNMAKGMQELLQAAINEDSQANPKDN